MKKCAACGGNNQPDAMFCSNCGQRLQQAAGRKCPSCGADNETDAAFCTNCGTRMEGGEAPAADQSPIAEQLLALNSEFLSVRQTAPGCFEFSSDTGAASPLQRVKIKYDAWAILEPATRQLVFWEKMVESSSGMQAGVFTEKTKQKGIEVGKGVHGELLFGGKYGFEYGNLREVVKNIAAGQGWKFKLSIFKPKAPTPAAGSGRPGGKIPLLKIFAVGAAVLLVLLLLMIGYCSLSGGSSKQSSRTDMGIYEEDEGEDGRDGVYGENTRGTGEHGQIIMTDRKVYSSGEEIRVNYYRAPGGSRDWICIVPVGSRNTDAGDYQYIPQRGDGVMTFRSPGPGRYEARAFYRYNPGEYRITGRYTFTVRD